MTTTGYGVLAGDRLIGAGKIETSPRDPEPYRLWVLFSELLAVIREFGAHHVAVEEFETFYRSKPKDGGDPHLPPALRTSGGGQPRRGTHDHEAVNPYSMFMMKSAQSASQMAALVSGCPLYLYRVAEWKGGQRVTKAKIRGLAQQIYGVRTQDHNITDAIMIARHHALQGRLLADRGVGIPLELREAALRSTLAVPGQ